jgi:hypothetical protein
MQNSSLSFSTIIRLIWSGPQNPLPQRNLRSFSEAEVARDLAILWVVALVTLFALTYHYGGEHVATTRAVAQDQLVRQELDVRAAQVAYWHARYNRLADTAGEGAVLEAALSEQGGGR